MTTLELVRRIQAIRDAICHHAVTPALSLCNKLIDDVSKDHDSDMKILSILTDMARIQDRTLDRLAAVERHIKELNPGLA